LRNCHASARSLLAPEERRKPPAADSSRARLRQAKIQRLAQLLTSHPMRARRAIPGHESSRAITAADASIEAAHAGRSKLFPPSQSPQQDDSSPRQTEKDHIIRDIRISPPFSVDDRGRGSPPLQVRCRRIAVVIEPISGNLRRPWVHICMVIVAVQTLIRTSLRSEILSVPVAVIIDASVVKS